MLACLRRCLPICFVLLFLLSTSALAASRASFCKCTCGLTKTGNGTVIIPLGDNPDIDPDLDVDVPNPEGYTPASRRRSCDDCNRKFCLSYNLPALADCLPENKGKEEEIFTTCFQRDSAKDQAVVYTFILVTVGLLVYAGLQPYIEQRTHASGPASRSTSNAYASVPPAPRQESLQ